MSISTYAELKTAIANWLARDDLTDYIPDFITLFEATANRRLRVRQQIASTDLTPSGGAASLPSDFLTWRRVAWQGSTPLELDYADPVWLRSAYPGTESGTPKFFSIEGSNLIIRPTDTTTVQLLYYEKIDALSGTLNWLFSAHPDLYLFGSLAEAQGFNVDMEKMALWLARRDGIFAEIEKLDMKTRGPAAIRPMTTIV